MAIAVTKQTAAIAHSPIRKKPRLQSRVNRYREIDTSTAERTDLHRNHFHLGLIGKS